MTNLILLDELQLKALIGTRTQDVFDLLRAQGPLLASDLQTKLRFPSKAIFYQLNKLQAVGLVRVLDESKNAARYEAVAKRVRIERSYPSDLYRLLADQYAQARIRKVLADYLNMSVSAVSNPELHDLVSLQFTSLELASDDLQEFTREFIALVEVYRSKCSQVGKPSVRLFMLALPDLCGPGTKPRGTKKQ